MSPLLIGMMLHFHTSLAPYDGPITDTAFSELEDAGLIRKREKRPDGESMYQITLKGEAYVQYLTAMPLPIVRWELPGPWGLEAAERE